MKSLHRPDLYCWSVFDTERNVDFHSIAWIRPEGNIVIDPLPLSDHDEKHLQSLGGVQWIIVTNSDHLRASQEIATKTGAQIAAPHGEKDSFPIPVQRWLKDGESIAPGLEVMELNGSKTPGELALVLEETTLITGDLVRAHQAGRLMLLPHAKLSDQSLAISSVQRLAALPKIEAVLVGDGWPVFQQGHTQLHRLLASLL
jgi:Metallo-beta-lactamase superfamily